VGIDSVSAFACRDNPDDYDSFTYAGLDNLGLEPVDKEAYVYMFPDGNASIARRLVRSLIPAAIPAASNEAVVATLVRYDQFDVESHAVRLRLKSPAVGVQRESSPGDGVVVDYVRDGVINRVTARHSVLACYNGMIPYLCPALPEPQKQALHYGPKVPFLYTHVALRNWRAFAQLRTRHIVSPGAYHSYTALAFPVNSEGYRCTQNPDEPMVLFMMRAFCSPGLPRKEQHRAGRVELLGTPFDKIEHNVRDQLARMLAGTEFDGDRDIAAITVNRWAHGYTYEYDTLTDPEWPKGQAPHEIGRQTFGPVAIANADAAGAAYTDAAIDSAHRAVGELR
jgi:spermidine dehydrogenase